MRPHEWIDRRSLALHEAVADKLLAHPELIEVARENLRRWLARGPQPALIEWRQLLDTLSLDELQRLLRSPDERAARLRQSSPFAGVLTPRERQSILDSYGSQPA
jgi:hypothetical protein